MTSQAVIEAAKPKLNLSPFSEHHFEKKLSMLKDSQESIQALSSWCLQHRQHHKKIVACWFKVMKKVKIECRLTLFYLANDVIQYSKRKSLEFIQTWAPVLQKASTLVRDEKVKPNILRIFKIWEERGIFDEAFVADLTGLLESPKGVSSDNARYIAEFQPLKLIDKIRSCKTLEDDTDLKLSILKDSHLELTDADALRNSLKDRRHGADLVGEVGEGIGKMEAYVTALNDEIKVRSALIDLLDQGSVFYDHQKGEAKIVVNAYRNFGSRVKNLKRKLDELIPTLRETSPIPSPPTNAPSPPPDLDLDLPGEPVGSSSTMPTASIEQYYELAISETHPVHSLLQKQGEQNPIMGSYLGSTNLPFNLQRDLFSSLPETTNGKSFSSDNNTSEGKPIEVIGSQGKPDEGFNISEFLKSLSHGDSNASSDPSGPNIPGLEVESSVEGIPLPEHGDGPPKPPSQYLSNLEGVTSSSQQYTSYSTPPPVHPGLGDLVSSPLPLLPPPAPPQAFLDEAAHWGGGYPSTHMEDHSDWNNKLPPKFPTWGESWDEDEKDMAKDWSRRESSRNLPKMDETPMSPPMFEKEGFNEPVQYDDRSGTIAEDVDHRTLMMQHSGAGTRDARSGKKDVDHRNLISLTGPPAQTRRNRFQVRENMSWEKIARDLDYRVTPPPPPSEGSEIQATDQDYRRCQPKQSAIPSAPSPNSTENIVDSGIISDNVESVDMEMSDEETADANGSICSQNIIEVKRTEKESKKNLSHTNRLPKLLNQPSTQETRTTGPLKYSSPNSVQPHSSRSSSCSSRPLLPAHPPLSGLAKTPLLPTPPLQQSQQSGGTDHSTHGDSSTGPDSEPGLNLLDSMTANVENGNNGSWVEGERETYVKNVITTSKVMQGLPKPSEDSYGERSEFISLAGTRIVAGQGNQHSRGRRTSFPASQGPLLHAKSPHADFAICAAPVPLFPSGIPRQDSSFQNRGGNGGFRGGPFRPFRARGRARGQGSYPHW